MKPKLLVVDDDHSVLESLKKLLEREHYGVHSARCGVDALDYFKSNHTDLVVLDLNLGADIGWKVIHTMMELNPFVPTVIITAEFDQQERAVAAGVEALIEKPIDVPVFLKLISDLLVETDHQRMQRVCDDDNYLRHVTRNYIPYLCRLRERYDALFRLSSIDDGSPKDETSSGSIHGERRVTDRVSTLTRGFTRHQPGEIGSVAEREGRRALCPVLIVR